VALRDLAAAGCKMQFQWCRLVWRLGCTNLVPLQSLNLTTVQVGFFLDYSNRESYFYVESSMPWPKQVIPSVGPVFKFHRQDTRPLLATKICTNRNWELVMISCIYV
jgi:hypothetical protein